MTRNKPGNKNDDFTLDIDDSNIEQNPENHGSNHDKISLILSDLIPVIRPANNPDNSDGLNEDGIHPSIEDGETNVSVPQQSNVPKVEPKTKSSGILHLLRSKIGKLQVEPVGPDGPKEPEEQDEPHVDVYVQDEPVGPDEPKDKDEQQMEWKILLKTISTHKSQKLVQRQVDEFLSSKKLKKLE